MDDNLRPTSFFISSGSYVPVNYMDVIYNRVKCDPGPDIVNDVSGIKRQRKRVKRKGKEGVLDSSGTEISLPKRGISKLDPLPDLKPPDRDKKKKKKKKQVAPVVDEDHAEESELEETFVPPSERHGTDGLQRPKKGKKKKKKVLQPQQSNLAQYDSGYPVQEEAYPTPNYHPTAQHHVTYPPLSSSSARIPYPISVDHGGYPKERESYHIENEQAVPPLPTPRRLPPRPSNVPYHPPSRELDGWQEGQAPDHTGVLY